MLSDESIADEVPFELPEGWCWARLESVIDIASNLVNPREYETVAHVAPDNIEKGTGKLLDCRTVLEDSVKSSNHRFSSGQILYSKIRPALKKAAIAPFDGLCSADMYPLDSHLDTSFTLILVLSDMFTRQVLKGDTRVKMPKTNQKALRVVLLPIPPLAEQRRIAERVSELMRLVDAYGELEDAREELDAALPDRLRRSVLQEAVRGRLVPQDPSDEPAGELLGRIRAERRALAAEGKAKLPKGGDSVIFTGSDGRRYEKRVDAKGREPEPVCIESEIPFEIPEGWEWTRLGTVFSMQAGKNIKASDILDNKSVEALYPCFGGNGIRGFVSKPNVSGDHPLIGRQGALCGNVQRATGAFYATEHAVVVTTFASTNVAWACMFLKALNLNQYATATAQPGLAISKLCEVLIPFPPLMEQTRIVTALETTLDVFTNQ
ncbi:restriction endonuclease subunit S [Enorma burkinafasonensis]|uniref:restriction endonuclease subunit S n=1 Tax=Enorma burkinafasonensis TaxID=2590867 RepID=UPI0016437E51|nr:restriction endonuclease subunit S [Enorma burkinafasonensis]